MLACTFSKVYALGATSCGSECSVRAVKNMLYIHVFIFVRTCVCGCLNVPRMPRAAVVGVALSFCCFLRFNQQCMCSRTFSVSASKCFERPEEER